MIEQVLEKMKEVLQIHLADELDRQDANADDGILCDKVSSYVIGDQIMPSTGFPVIVLRAESMEQDLFASGVKDVNYRIAIGVGVSDTDHDRAQRKLWRTMRAIECALEVFAPGNSPIIEYKTEGMDYHAPLFSIEEGKSTEKAGIIQAMVKERLSSYTAGQV